MKDLDLANTFSGFSDGVLKEIIDLRWLWLAIIIFTFLCWMVSLIINKK